MLPRSPYNYDESAWLNSRGMFTNPCTTALDRESVIQARARRQLKHIDRPARRFPRVGRYSTSRTRARKWHECG
jgi:hypothetical protein